MNIFLHYTAGMFSVLIITGLLIGEAEAIPPPEIIRLGPVLAQVLAMVILFLSTFFFFIRGKLIAIFSAVRSNKYRVLLVSVPLILIAASLVISAAYVNNKNRQIIASATPADETVSISDGKLTLASMEFAIKDPSLSISPQKTDKLLGNNKYIFIDIREPVEFETRHIPSFINMRLGDLITGLEYRKIDKNRKIVLICEAGERGSSVAAYLRMKGYEAFFVEKGIRGWVDADLRIIGNKTLILPEFKGKHKTIETDEAKALVSKGRAKLIDVRTAVEYAKGHVEGAINIPLVNLPSKDLEKALSNLPRDKAFIGLGYDRFGYYYCLILAYMLEQRNLEYGGTLLYVTKNQTL